MKRQRHRGGFTFVDAVLAIVLVSVSFLVLATVISSTTLQNAGIDFSSTAALLARGRMAEVMARDFDDIADVAQANFSGDFAGFNSEVSVDYVDAANLDTPVAGPTDYKRVAVDVRHLSWAGCLTFVDLKVTLE